MACEEMQLFYAYLDAVEEAKRKAQPWQCEVTIFPEEGGAVTLPAAETTAASTTNTAGFSCDEPE
jgi:hypothetical protein